MEFIFEDNEESTRKPYSSSSNNTAQSAIWTPPGQKSSSDTMSTPDSLGGSKLGGSKLGGSKLGSRMGASKLGSSLNASPASPASLTSSSPAKRKSVPAKASDVELTPNPRRKRKSAKVSYLKNAKTPKRKNKSEKFTWSWNKVGWLVCFGVFLRLIFMDRGVAQYYQMQETLTEKKRELKLIEEENIELMSEIHQIKVNPLYQKKAAREHLGVIARDEYLILFATDARPRSI